MHAFAAVRGVTINGEMDVPGHSKAATHALPALFAFPSSPQLDIINFVNESVIVRLQEIFLEIDAVLPSPYFAIGGDEVDFAAVEGLPEVVAAAKVNGYIGAMDLYRAFIEEMRTFATKHNKTLLAWEGFGPVGGQGGHKPANASSVAISPESMVVNVFDGVYYNPPKLAADGYKMINSATSPLYSNVDWSQPELIYQWHPWLFGDLAYPGYTSWWELPDELRGAVEGVKVCAWGQRSDVMLQGLRQKAPAMADRSWSPMAMRSYVDFESRFNKTDATLQRLIAGVLPPSPPPPPSPSPPSPPPVPNGNFSSQPGACRDQQGGYSARVEQHSIKYSACKAKCDSLGMRCDAMDINGAVPSSQNKDPTLEWCGVWGTTITANDASSRFQFYPASGQRVCRGDAAAGETNTCFRRPPFC